MRYYISDLHFSHDALNHAMDCRGFRDEQDMNEYMIRQWNSRVRKNDEVVVLGDLSMGNWEQTKEILDQLKGKIYLIQGNHDRFVKDKAFDPSRFLWVRSYAEMHDNGRKVILSHYPVLCYNGQNRRSKHGNPKTYMLHGHVHDTLDQRLLEQFQTITRNTLRGDQPIPCNLLNCFCMYSDYVPWGLDEWIAYHEEKFGKDRSGTQNKSMLEQIYSFNGKDITMNVCIQIRDVIKLLQEHFQISFEEAILRFYKSETYKTLQETENGLWAESAEYIANRYYDEAAKIQ